MIMAKTNSYSRFWTLLAKMPCSDRDGLKLQLVSSFTNGRTDSLREMTLSEYNSMIREMEKQTGSSRPVSYEVLKKKRSAVLHQMQLMGIDTANWAAVDNFCLGVRIAGKKFRELSADDLDAVLLRIRSIRQKDMQKAKKELSSARLYALSQSHKHLKEMKAISGLERTPLFSPMVTDYYSGMTVSLTFYADMLNGRQTPETVREYLAKHYAGEKFITVQPLGAEAESGGVLFSSARSGWDGLEIYVTGNEDRIMVTTRFDNLGKGASGAAIQCMNIVLGCEEDKGLTV